MFPTDPASMSRKRSRDSSSPKPRTDAMGRPTPSVPANDNDNDDDDPWCLWAQELQWSRDRESACDASVVDRRHHIWNEILMHSNTSTTPAATAPSPSPWMQKVIQELVRTIYTDCLGIENESMDSEPGDRNDPAETTLRLDPRKLWIQPPTKRQERMLRLLQRGAPTSTTKNLPSIPSSQNLPLLHLLLTILRNLSYVGANARWLAYSPSVLQALSLCLALPPSTGDDYDTSSNDSNNRSQILQRLYSDGVLPTLLHVAPSLDWTGQRLATDRLLYVPPMTAASSATPDGYAVPVEEFMDGHGSFGQLAETTQWGWMGLYYAKRYDARDDIILPPPPVTSRTQMVEKPATEGAESGTASSRSGQDHVAADILVALAGTRFLASLWSMFYGLNALLSQQHLSKQTILLALDLLLEIVNQARVGVMGSLAGVSPGVAPTTDATSNLPSLRAVLVHMPEVVLDRILECLYIPKHGPDAWGSGDVTGPSGRSVGGSINDSYDAVVDTDIRDRALELLVPLMELDSPRMAARVGSVAGKIGTDGSDRTPRWSIYYALVPVLTTSTGKAEASVWASQCLRELSKAPENQLGLECIQERLVELASRNARIAQLVWNHLYVDEKTNSAGYDDLGAVPNDAMSDEDD